MPEENILDLAKRIKSIADKGLLYAQDNFDQERYHELKDISLQLMSTLSNLPAEKINGFYGECKDYPTPKVDVRSLVLNNDGKILMVQEKADARWSLPGGWADIGSTASETAVKEVREETGLIVNAERLLAVFDKRMHLHPPQPYYVYKMFFHCKLISENETVLTPAFDVLDAVWFDISELPPLSEDRVLASQIQLLYKHIQDNNSQTLFD